MDYNKLLDEIANINEEVFSSALHEKEVNDIDIVIYDMSEDIIEKRENGFSIFVEIPAGTFHWVNAHITIEETVCNGEVNMEIYLGEEWRDMDTLFERKKKYNASDAAAYWRIYDGDKKDSLIILCSHFKSNMKEDILRKVRTRLEYLLTNEFTSAINPMQPYIEYAYND